MRSRLLAALTLLIACAFALPASASLLITIDKSSQRMTVEQDGLQLFVWPVSTGARGYDTPSGSYKPFRMEKDHFSKEWDDAPMPNSIFFTMEGHAIHGTTHLKAIGTPASHGCVRLAPENAETLWNLIKQEKMANTRVVLRGETPAVAAPGVASAPAQRNPRIASGEDDGFTGALPPTPRGQRLRAPPGAAYFDGRFFYDRGGRRIAEVMQPREYRGYGYYERDYYGRSAEPPPPRMARPPGFFPGWN